jgi:prefoldin subunit 5
MNAVIREKYEARVLRNETIEVHLQYLRSGFDAVQAALPVLRDKIDLLSTRVDEKIDMAAQERAAGDAALGAKIDKAVEKLEASDAALGGKIDKLAETVTQIAIGQAEIQGLVKTMIWLLSTAGIVGSVVSIAHAFEWI